MQGASLVEAVILVCHNQDGRVQGIVNIYQQIIDLLELLRLTYYHNLLV